MFTRKRRRENIDTSNTWWLFACLNIYYFLFRWHLIYSVTTSSPCRTLGEYWLTSGGYFPNLYSMFLLIFILFAAWSAAELICAVAGNKEDKLVAVTVNPLIILFLCYLFYGFTKQWEYFEIQRDIQLYSESYTRPKAYTYQANELFRDFLAQKYCSGETERLYPYDAETEDRLYAEFIERGWVRPGSPPEWQ